MAKMSLLDMVQDILSDMDSDEVNSITDTVEALQVAGIVKSTYFSIIDGKHWPHLNKLFQLNPSLDISRPTHMSLPDRITNVEWVKYDCKEYDEIRDKVRRITYKTPEDFMKISEGRDNTAANVMTVIDYSDIHMNIMTDRAPTYWTSFDNVHIVFDSFDIAVDTTLQNSKTQCYGSEYPVWEMVNAFVPNLPIDSFSYLLNEAKSAASLRLRQVADQKAEQHSVSQRRRMSQSAWHVANQRGITYPNYGRKK